MTQNVGKEKIVQDVLQSNGVRGGRMRKTLRLLDWIVRQGVDGHDENI